MFYFWLQTAYTPFPVTDILIPVMVAIMATIVMSIVYKNKPKIDRGRVIIYFQLSYRRKLIRSLWTFPIHIAIILLAIYITHMRPTVEILVFIAFLTGNCLQIGYNYRMYKKTEA